MQQNVEVFGISGDSAESHAKFKDSLSLPFSLLADPGLEMSRRYDAVVSHQGTEYAARKIVLIDAEGKISYRDDDYDLSTDDDLNKVLAEVKKL